MSDTTSIERLEKRLGAAWLQIQEIERTLQKYDQRIFEMKCKYDRIQQAPLRELIAEIPQLTLRVQAIENWIPKKDQPTTDCHPLDQDPLGLGRIASEDHPDER